MDGCCCLSVNRGSWIINRVFHFQSVRGRKKRCVSSFPSVPWCSRQIFKWRLWKFLGCTLDLSCKAGPRKDCCLHPMHLCPAQPTFGSLPSKQTTSNKTPNWDASGEILGPNDRHSGSESGKLWNWIPLAPTTIKGVCFAIRRTNHQRQSFLVNVATFLQAVWLFLSVCTLLAALKALVLALKLKMNTLTAVLSGGEIGEQMFFFQLV